MRRIYICTRKPPPTRGMAARACSARQQPAGGAALAAGAPTNFPCPVSYMYMVVRRASSPARCSPHHSSEGKSAAAAQARGRAPQPPRAARTRAWLHISCVAHGFCMNFQLSLCIASCVFVSLRSIYVLACRSRSKRVARASDTRAVRVTLANIQARKGRGERDSALRGHREVVALGGTVAIE